MIFTTEDTEKENSASMATSTTRIMYIELKSGHRDSGPARIGRVSFSKTGRTIYYGDQQFLAIGGSGISGNYIDIETRDEYWIPGPKKDGTDRHWAGGGTVYVDKDVADEYWRM